MLMIRRVFMERQTGEEYTRWTVRMPDGFPRRCDHAHFISCHDGSLGLNPNQAAEKEFLFAAYSAFRVEQVTWREHPTLDQPHEIVVQVNGSDVSDMCHIPGMRLLHHI